MKKQSRKLFSLLMVFALLGGLFCNVDTVNAQETRTIVPRSEYARQVTVPKQVYYNGVSVGTINCIIGFTYGLSSGQPMVNTKSYSISTTSSTYSVKVTSITVTNGNPATVTYNYTVYKDEKNGQSASAQVFLYNNGNYV